MVNLLNATILPAIRDLKDLDKVVQTHFEYIVLLNTHIGQLKSLVKMLHDHDKKVLLHADLVQGLKNDEYAAQFLCRDIRPEGLVSTRKSVLLTAKKAKLLTVQRLFLLDSLALESSYNMVDTIQPDCIEVLPGIMPHIIKEIYEKTNTPVIAGGLIRTEEEVKAAIQAGAAAVTTSKKTLWDATI
ncbi:glycerol-3-phosphate responsive antiterminator [Salipaludibacillus sp. LMS25]|jgi:glycerol uptake operon antiterminator|uniref:glycerol-3-phosphate responsive antiterminator n=1 Tax=Salipaludibacillus sp. LMS25 TaxID=2924031 RepID=UPI0020D197A6|nr:glycerol-3-phosphate responsive antiterminator [Salipaludibacillus sp. LMS25]UTR14148.1 glycerol-3-phosphate responsive antiterminator [Salipaludibacillus sp. LMS25]